MYSAPVKSTPVMVNGATSLRWSLGNSAGSGAEYGLPWWHLQIVQWRRSRLMHCQPEGTQYCCLSAVRAMFTPPWKSELWSEYMSNFVKPCFGGRRCGNLALSLRGALWIRPPHLRRPSSSRKRRSCLTKVGALLLDLVVFCDLRVEISLEKVCSWQVLIHISLAVLSSVGVSGPVILRSWGCLMFLVKCWT